MGKSFNFTWEQPFSSSVTANSLAITTAPITSWYTTFINLQRSYKAIESVPYNNVAASANSILLTAKEKGFATRYNC
jgi:hypothetical protein